MSEKQLFIVSTQGVGDFYVIAGSFDQAAELIKNELDKQNYGYSNDRTVVSVKFVCQQRFYDGKRYFCEDNTNLLVWGDGKEGEQKHVQEPNIVIPLFRVGDTIRIKDSNAEYTITDISDGYYRGKGWCLDIVEGDASGDYELVEREPVWKPTDEQINVLVKLEEAHVMEHERNQENAHMYMVLKSLKEDLYKLRNNKATTL